MYICQIPRTAIKSTRKVQRIQKNHNLDLEILPISSQCAFNVATFAHIRCPSTMSLDITVRFHQKVQQRMYHQIVKNREPSACLLIQLSFTSERAAADAPPDRKECRPKFKVGSTDLSLFNVVSSTPRLSSQRQLPCSLYFCL